MIFYFTGTGNSLYVAKQLDEIQLSIPQVIHDADLSFKASSIGIVCPIYGHEMPEMVKEFVKRATFDTEYFYLILTYGRIHGGAAELAEQMMSSCGKKADYINTIMMADNFLPGFDMKEQIAINPEKKVEEHIASIKNDINARKCWKQPVTQEDRDWHKNYLERQSHVPADFFQNLYHVTEECIGCGVCTNICPVGCIHLEHQKAVHTMENCQMCMACIHHCPQNAIRLGIPEKNQDARYHNENIKLTEIVAANNQHK